MSVDADLFRRALGRFPSGVTVVSIRDADDRDQGMTVSAFSSVSLLPPLVLACIGDDATLASAMAHATAFGVSVLADEQESLSQRFAETAARRFDEVPHVRGTTGVALVAGAIAHLECHVVARHHEGDHTIVVGKVVTATTFPGRPLVHFGSAYVRLA